MRPDAISLWRLAATDINIIRSFSPRPSALAVIRQRRLVWTNHERATKFKTKGSALRKALRSPFQSATWYSSLHSVDSTPQDLQSTLPSGKALPRFCPGCGAPTQSVSPTEAGYYTSSRKAVRSYLGDVARTTVREDEVFSSALANASSDVRHQLGVGGLKSYDTNADPSPLPSPVCDRCHHLINYHSGVPIHHPTVEAIRETIDESPYKQNHIYHVIDAADFPMSLVPNLQSRLDLSPLRSQNRRSAARKYVRGRVAEVSFIITRSDLLAPSKEQVDSLMVYLVEVLRKALGRTGENLRLGNVRCVSAKRGWWTTEVKRAIWKRGGAGWMVGKVNVGKSNLFEVVFPKGHGENVNMQRLRSERDRTAAFPANMEAETEREPDGPLLDTDSLLPPPQQETPYPVMPLVSALPGTTAAPIRVPFGGGRGELIDLPGLPRSMLEDYVRPESKKDLVMKSRISPERLTVKPGKSLLLGGLIRITPTTPDLIFLVHPFIPLESHITSTARATDIQTGQRQSGVPVIANSAAAEHIASAGKFRLWWDVTRRQAGPLTRPSAVALKPEQLPFIVYSADILVEGCGWIEVVAQVRRKRVNEVVDQARQDPFVEPDESFPEVEVFSPEGKFIGIRPPMGAWLLGGKVPLPRSQRKTRPRRSMRSIKVQRIPTSKT